MYFDYRKLKDKDVTSKSDPVCILYSQDPGQQSLHEIGRTEQITNNLNPQWVTKFELDYRFEERQVSFNQIEYCMLPKKYNVNA